MISHVIIKDLTALSRFQPEICINYYFLYRGSSVPSTVDFVFGAPVWLFG